MSEVFEPVVEIDGGTATLEQIWLLDLSDAGHFTAMQVRGGKTLGIEFHLARLDAATQELFGVMLGGERVRSCIRHALSGHAADASVRVNVFRVDTSGDVSVAVSLRPPASAPKQALRLQRSSISDRSPTSSVSADSVSPTWRASPRATGSTRLCSSRPAARSARDPSPTSRSSTGMMPSFGPTLRRCAA